MDRVDGRMARDPDQADLEADRVGQADPAVLAEGQAAPRDHRASLDQRTRPNFACGSGCVEFVLAGNLFSPEVLTVSIPGARPNLWRPSSSKSDKPESPRSPVDNQSPKSPV